MIQTAFVKRLVALTKKEIRQMLRDRSNLIVGLLLPITLILLFGYGISFDVKNTRVALVVQNDTPVTRDVLAGLHPSVWIKPVIVHSMHAADQMMRKRDIDAIVQLPSDFSKQVGTGHAQVQLVLNGKDSNISSAVEGYVNGMLAMSALHQKDRVGSILPAKGNISIVQRIWFNEANNSTWFLVPGLIVLVMTLIGAFLTSLLIAREWERGTLESLFVTPVRPLELVLAKLLPYLVVGMIDLGMCLVAARFLFEVPMRGSLAVIIITALLYLLVSLSLGLFISGTTRNQFSASQIALLTSFMPATMLSGFVFDLRNVPIAIQAISQILPATHFMSLIKTLFMAGDNWPAIFRAITILGLYAVILIFLTQRTLRKKLD
ncbi:hypothetical protein AD951_03950 [Acetobacter malorum]|uniref:Transport permease protein n=1 Tax=Acetobacter malorum TaxID=178901 RepID=A0A149UQI2_9PROT|nr:ABC transporter permease [Acetobacter malorum]KXV70073.1 hypothetical protein AD951_03950 [Acetobacter malorum]